MSHPKLHWNSIFGWWSFDSSIGKSACCNRKRMLESDHGPAQTRERRFFGDATTRKELTMQLTGIHHLTAISAKPRENLAFYTGLLGLRLVKKTVNQDDVSAYHLFYADGKANPGTDLTFFDFPAAPERRGTNAISRTGLRVAGAKTLGYWRDRLRQARAAIRDIGEGGRRV